MKQYFRVDMPNTLTKSESEAFEQAVLQRVEVIRNKMLGDFDEKGIYQINSEMAKELLAMRKYLVERYDTQCLVESENIFDKRLYFSLKVEENLVTFSVLEKMRYGTNLEHKSPYCNIKSTVLEQLVLDKKPKNLEEILFNHYNIHIAETPDSLDVKDMSPAEIEQYFYTIDRKLMIAEKERELKSKERMLEEVEKAYYLDTMYALKKSGTYGKQVISEMEQRMITVRPFIDPKRPGYYKSLNQILGTIVQSNRTEENKAEVQTFETKIDSARRRYAEDLSKAIPMISSPVTDDNNKQQKLDQLTIAITSGQSKEVKAKQQERAERDSRQSADKKAVTKTEPAKKQSTKASEEKAVSAGKSKEKSKSVTGETKAETKIDTSTKVVKENKPVVKADFKAGKNDQTKAEKEVSQPTKTEPASSYIFDTDYTGPSLIGKKIKATTASKGGKKAEAEDTTSFKLVDKVRKVYNVSPDKKSGASLSNQKFKSVSGKTAKSGQTTMER